MELANFIKKKRIRASFEWVPEGESCGGCQRKRGQVLTDPEISRAPKSATADRLAAGAHLRETVGRILHVRQRERRTPHEESTETTAWTRGQPTHQGSVVRSKMNIWLFLLSHGRCLFGHGTVPCGCPLASGVWSLLPCCSSVRPTSPDALLFTAQRRLRKAHRQRQRDFACDSICQNVRRRFTDCEVWVQGVLFRPTGVLGWPAHETREEVLICGAGRLPRSISTCLGRAFWGKSFRTSLALGSSCEDEAQVVARPPQQPMLQTPSCLSTMRS